MYGADLSSDWILSNIIIPGHDLVRTPLICLSEAPKSSLKTVRGKSETDVAPGPLYF